MHVKSLILLDIARLHKVKDGDWAQHEVPPGSSPAVVRSARALRLHPPIDTTKATQVYESAILQPTRQSIDPGWADVEIP
eukprot:5104451-Alexandrium_andersonii.AAC.1